MGIWDVLFRDDRDKNTHTLIELELLPAERKKILESLNVKDYSEGPLPEQLYGGADMLVFGKLVKRRKYTSK